MLWQVEIQVSLVREIVTQKLGLKLFTLHIKLTQKTEKLQDMSPDKAIFQSLISEIVDKSPDKTKATCK